MAKENNQFVGIIGAGPAGYTAATAALQLGYEVELIDPWNFATPNSSPFNSTSVKTRFGSSEMYQYPSKYISSVTDVPVPASGVVGGFSTVWGAGISYDVDVLSKYYESELINEAAVAVKRIFLDFDGSHYVSERFSKLLNDSTSGFSLSQLAVDEFRCNLSGACMTGCLNSAIWSCETQWKALAESCISVKKGFAKTIKESNRGVFVTIDINGQEETYRYDSVLVSCGAVASASLGQRSGIFPSSIELGETAISYLPFIIASQWKPYLEQRFTLSQIFYSKTILKRNQKIWLSLFEASNFLKEQANLKLGRKIQLIPELLWRYLGVAIHYSPESLSKKLALDFRDGVSWLSCKQASIKSIRYFWILFRDIAKDFYANGLLIFPGIRIKGKPGASYHFGHITYKGEDLLDQDGKTESESKIAFIDSLSLKELPVGPITAISMMNAWLKTNSHLKPLH